MRVSTGGLHPVITSLVGIVSGMRDAVIAGGARTAAGRPLGSLSEFSAAHLGGIVIRAPLGRAGGPADRVGYAITGPGLHAGPAPIPTPHAAGARPRPPTAP